MTRDWRAISSAIGAVGGGPEELHALTATLDGIAARGHMTDADELALSEIGIPTREIRNTQDESVLALMCLFRERYVAGECNAIA